MEWVMVFCCFLFVLCFMGCELGEGYFEEIIR